MIFAIVIMYIFEIYIAELLVLLENMECAYVKFYFQIYFVRLALQNIDSRKHSMETEILRQGL
jgi:hypothetical protein